MRRSVQGFPAPTLKGRVEKSRKPFLDFFALAQQFFRVHRLLHIRAHAVVSLLARNQVYVVDMCKSYACVSNKRVGASANGRLDQA